MRLHGCPLGCPVAWNMKGEPVCSGAVYYAHLPANDLPQVSQYHRSRRLSRLAPIALRAVGGDGPAGVADCFPVAGPLPCCRCPRPSLSPIPAEPTKEKKSKEAPARAAGGGQ